MAFVQAGDRPERTTQTLRSFGLAENRDIEVVVVAPVEHALRAAFGDSVRFISPADLPALELREPRGIAIVEDGAVLPSDWRIRVEAHFANAPETDALAACTNHSAGPERLPSEVLSRPLRRFDAETWSAHCANMQSRWPSVTEEREFISSPFVYFAPGAHNSHALRQYWARASDAKLVNPSAAIGSIQLKPDARLLLCWDLPVWREPGRSTSRQRVGVEGYERRLGDEALRWFGPLESDPNSTHPPAEHLQLAAFAVRTGSLESGIGHAQACLRRWPGHVYAQIWMAEAGVKSGRGEAIRHKLDALRQAIPLSDERRAHLLACLGESWRHEGDGQSAERCLERSLALDPLQALALDSIGLVELEAGRFDFALDHFQRAVRSDSTYASAWSNLGRAWAMVGEHDRAREALVRALAIQPGQREARELLARIA